MESGLGTDDRYLPEAGSEGLLQNPGTNPFAFVVVRTRAEWNYPVEFVVLHLSGSYAMNSFMC